MCLRVTRTAPTIDRKSSGKLQSTLVLPENVARRGEGGLRTKVGNYLSSWGQSVGSDTEKSKPLVTVISAVFNGAQTLEQTILSVISQSYDNIEFIIIDGGSTDGTLDILRKYDHVLDYWVSEPDGGIYDAWNKGVCLSQGEWISFVGADDFYFLGAIQAYITSINDCRGNLPEYVSSRINLATDQKVLRVVGHQWSWDRFRKYMNVAHVGSLHRRILFERYGLFDTTYKVSGDYEFLLRARSGLRAAYLNSVTVQMRIGGASDSNLLSFCETARAKVTTGGRSALMSYIEMIVAVGKFKLRKLLWY